MTSIRNEACAWSEEADLADKLNLHTTIVSQSP